MKKLVALAVLIAATPAVGAPPPESTKSIYASLKEIQVKASAARKSHAPESAACVTATSALRQKAFDLRGKVNSISAFSYSGAYDDKLDLNQAVDQATTCTWCANDGAACKTLGTTLRKVEARWATGTKTAK